MGLAVASQGQKGRRGGMGSLRIQTTVMTARRQADGVSPPWKFDCPAGWSWNWRLVGELWGMTPPSDSADIWSRYDCICKDRVRSGRR